MHEISSQSDGSFWTVKQNLYKVILINYLKVAHTHHLRCVGILGVPGGNSFIILSVTVRSDAPKLYSHDLHTIKGNLHSVVHSVIWRFTKGQIKTLKLFSLNLTVCDLSSGSQSAAAGGGEPWGSSSAGRGGLPRRYAAGEDPECTGWHRPIPAPHPQRGT